MIAGRGGATCGAASRGAAAWKVKRLRPGALGATAGARRSCSRSISTASSAPRFSMAVCWRRLAGGIVWLDVAAPASHAINAAPTTTIVVVRFTVIRNSRDRSTRRFGLCYYSSCTLHRLVQESIRFLRSPSSPSSPPDTLRRGFLARHSPTSTAAR